VSHYYLEATAFAKLFVREAGTDALIRLMESVEDNRKLISAATPLEVYAAIGVNGPAPFQRKTLHQRSKACDLNPRAWCSSH
jgi:hypothetical protein